MTKPPYQLPTMDAIAEVKGTNGYKVLSTFSGCGGSCLGLEQAGFEIIFASEFIPAAQDTYALNHPGVPLSPQDIREIEPELLLAFLGLEVGELDVLEGSPPCASFSTAGKGAAGWSANETFRQRLADGEFGAPASARGDTKKYSDTETAPPDDLFLEYVRLAKVMQPKVLVAENVSGLSKGNAIGYFKMIHKAIEDAGYVLNVRLLDAQWLGVPQQRVRTIFVAVRRDLVEAHGVKPAFPKPIQQEAYSLREALGLAASTRLHQRVGGVNVELPIGDEPAPSITANGLGGTSNRGGEGELIEEVIGVEYDDRRPGHEAVDVTDSPARTILAGGDSNKNGTDHQVLTRPVRVIHDSSGGKDSAEGKTNDYSAGDVTDRPSPAITVGVGGLNSSHWIVEEEVVGMGSRTSRAGEETRSADEPAQAIQAHSGHRADVWVEEVVGGTKRTGHGYTERPLDLDEPAPTVVTGDGYSPDLEIRGVAMVPKGRDHSFHDADEPAPTVMAEGIGDVRQYQALVDGGPPLDCEHRFLDPPASQQCLDCGINHEELAAITMDGYAIGREWDKLGVGEQSDKYLNLVRPDPEKPSPTVTQTAGQQGAAGVTHPTQRRKFTIQELKAVCGFPADFILTGSYRQQWERLGRAVPPPMMYAVGVAVREQILDRIPR